MRLFRLHTLLLVIAALALGPLFTTPGATAQEGSDEIYLEEGTVVEYLAGEKITIRVPGENEGEETNMDFTITEDTETYGEIVVGVKVEVEYKEEGVALFIGTLGEDS